ncbi:nicotinamide-nucleotide amidase [Quadrisphaera granulorum]|uniref:Nicotinamide-nucleotide amidase n=1 Tax=Quadrisphaera granulorum TaxID=317664 RepID=A0A315ZX86_9ACTN|nr:nicotinamide-nucleotide amidohydrolase family protein [Quadrisphaera granulorum]PWJ49893.1 nicotinamide-nucleotide amidase [Quadrisphaera granulorum]SZE98101.1 nicotinamide-nucleotide amidase [Quadrisphaera granulorum]
MELPERVITLLRDAGLTVATAESLTAGLVSARLADVPGASDVLRGGVVSYATDVKTSLLSVSEELLNRTGPVHRAVAEAMAVGVCRRLHSDVGVATTGVAGPGPHDGHPAGTVVVAVATADGVAAEVLRLPGDRAAVREGAVRGALELLARVLEPGALQPRAERDGSS